jgi:hypothetical protein
MTIDLSASFLSGSGPKKYFKIKAKTKTVKMIAVGAKII